MSVKVNRHRIKVLNVETRASGNHVTVSHFLWMARELQAAVEAGMPKNTTVEIRNETQVDGVTMTARCQLSEQYFDDHNHDEDTDCYTRCPAWSGS